MKYYFLVCLLPEIHLEDAKLKVSLDELLGEKFHFAPEDSREIDLILLGGDILILEKMLAGKTVAVRQCLYGTEFWKDQLKSPRDGPEFILEFLEGTDPDSFGIEDVDRLYLAYYDYVLAESSNEFLINFYKFEKDLRNIASAVRARRKGLAPAGFLVGEGDVVDLLSRSNAEDFGLAQDFPWLEELLAAEGPDELQRLMETVIWDYLDDHIEPVSFAFNAILAYFLKLRILEQRLALDKLEGERILQRLEGN